MHKNLPTVEGLKTRFLCSIIADEGTNTTLAGYVKVGGESLPMTADGENELVAPATPAGDYLYELRAGGLVVMWGNLCARPSAFPPEGEYTDIEVSAEMAAEMVIGVQAELGSGPRGEKGERGEEGPRGYSAYEIACQEGFVGTEAEWLEAMRQETATLAVQQVTPLTERAERAATEAANSETAAGENEAAAASSAAAAQGYALAAEKNAKVAEEAAGEADAARAGAQDAQSDAEMAAEGAAEDAKEAAASASGAAEQAGAAEASAEAAAKSAREAAGSAIAANTSKANAEKSATEAATSATAAAESATAAAESVDMAEMSLPCDYMRFAHVTSFKELAQQAPDLIETEVWRYPLNSLDNAGETSMDTYFKRLRRVCLYSEAASVWSSIRDPDYRIVPFFNNSQLEEVRVVYPKAKSISYMTPWGSNSVERLYVYAPQATNFNIYAVAGFYPRWVWLYVASENIDNWILQSGVRTIAYIGPVAKKINQSCLKKLTEVLCGFPVATLLNFQKAQLNKESVLRIVNSLQPYNPATMTEMPQLTVGIDPALDGDEEINAALLLAQTSVEDGGKGWSVAVAGFTITAGGATATFGLRRPVYARRWEAAEGDYVDADGTRWCVRWGNTVLENWVANEQLGYDEFASIEDALEAWGLTVWEPKQQG